jgi:hypothetical protein
VQPSLTIMSKTMQSSPWACPEGIQWETNYSYTHSLTHTRGQWVVSFGCRSPYSWRKKIPLHPLNRNGVGSRAILNTFGETKIVLLKPRV